MVPRIGNHLFSTIAPTARGATTTVGDNSKIEIGDEHTIPAHKCVQVSVLNQDIGENLDNKKKVIEQGHNEFLTGQNADTWHGRLGHLNEKSINTLQGSAVSFQGKVGSGNVCCLGKSNQ